MSQSKLLKRNISLSYILAACATSWFFLGVWILYYLRFTDYAGVGLLEAIMIFTITLAEIPSGALADLIGKRRTLFLSFIIQTIGVLSMALATDFNMLIFSVLAWAIGGALFSGTLEALAFDSLKDLGEEERYHKVIANLNSIQFLSPAICSLIGGFLYAYNVQLPYFLNAGFYFLGAILSLFLLEPKIDSEQFSLTNYWRQSKQGLKQLFGNGLVAQKTILFLSIGLVFIITDNLLNNLLGVEYGFSEQLMGVLWGVFYLVAALGSQLTHLIRRFLPWNVAIFVIGFSLALILILTPLLGMVIGMLTLLLIYALQAIQSNLTSVAINQQTTSKYRVTTLSTFNMLQNLPYALSAYFIGSIANQYSAKMLAFGLGIMLLILLLAQSKKMRSLVGEPL